MKFCLLPICCQFISTHIYQFWSIYLKQDGIKSDSFDFIANDE